MPVAIVLAAAVILGGVIVVAMGRGGELSRDRPERPVHADFRTWSDVAGYQPPAALLGYNARATQYALSLIARTLAERDAEIAWLRDRIAELRPASPDGPASSDSTSSPDVRAGIAPAGEVAAGVVAEDDGPTGELPRVVVAEDRLPGDEFVTGDPGAAVVPAAVSADADASEDAGAGE